MTKPDHLIPDPPHPERLSKGHLSSGSEPPAWTQAFIGIPFRDLGRDRAGCDCYGLNRLVMLSRGVVLPLHDRGYEAANDSAATGALIEAGIRGDGCWVPVPWGARRAFDWIVYRKGVLPVHLALVADRDWIFHTRRGAVSGSERVASVPLRHEHALMGLYRYQGSGIRDHSPGRSRSFASAELGGSNKCSVAI